MIGDCIGGVPAITDVTDVVDPERGVLITVVVWAERGDALSASLAAVIACDPLDETRIRVLPKKSCNRHLAAGAKELEGSIPADTGLGFFRAHGTVQTGSIGDYRVLWFRCWNVPVSRDHVARIG